MRTLFCMVALLACHNEHPRTAATAAPPPAPTPAATATPTKPASPHIAVADDLGAQCALHFKDVAQAPKFDFDDNQLLPEDRDVLDQIATCVTTGPLKGKRLQLVGRADPRGTEEYNLALGQRRAGTVTTYLERLGVHNTQLAATTRGAIDANGRDEAGWRVDRRVDLRLAN